MALQIEGDAESGYSLHGNLTYATVPGIFVQDLRLAGETRINLARVERIDSAGLALLVEWTCAARRQDKRVILEHIPNSLKSLIDVSGLQEVLSVAAD